MSTLPPASRPRVSAACLLFVTAVLLAAALAWHGPIAQWSEYHAFADSRAWLGIPNAADVLSNLPFAVAGFWGLSALVGSGAAARSKSAWIAFCLALIGTAFGSAFYHWAPDNLRLVFDRVPIACACVAIVAAFLAEHGLPRWASPGALWAGTIASAAAVLYWYGGELRGAGDLRAYLFIQLLPMLLVPAALLLRIPARAPGATPDPAWWLVLGCYAAAKAAEGFDREVLEVIGIASGHTLKHLLAALGAALLMRGTIRAQRSADQLR